MKYRKVFLSTFLESETFMNFRTLLIVFSFIITSHAMANDSLKTKANEAMNDTKRGVQKAGRAVKDKTCEMINGKMECAAQKVKHSIQNTADSLKDAID